MNNNSGRTEQRARRHAPNSDAQIAVLNGVVGHSFWTHCIEQHCTGEIGMWNLCIKQGTTENYYS